MGHKVANPSRVMSKNITTGLSKSVQLLKQSGVPTMDSFSPNGVGNPVAVEITQRGSADDG